MRRSSALDNLLTDRRMAPPKRKVVRWTDDEWQELAQRVWKKRARHPDMHLWDMVNSVQENASPGFEPWPLDRKRTVNGMHAIKPILPHLRQLDLELIERIDREIPALKDQVESFRSRPDKEQLLAQLTEEEIARRFAETIFRQLSPAEIIGRFHSSELLAAIPVAEVYAYLGQAIFGHLTAIDTRVSQHLLDHQHVQSNGHANGHANGHTNGHSNGHAKPRVAIVGAQQNQHPILLSHIAGRCELVFIAKANSKVECENQQINADHVVLWESYTTGVQRNVIKQRFPHERLTVHRGTFNQLVEKVESLPILGRRKPK